MMSKLRQIWLDLNSSLWFLPTLIVAGALGVAFGLIEADSVIDRHKLIGRWPWLFGAGAGGARAMLGAIASSMITVAGVAFSITIVALVLASSQYTSRILRNFMRDHANQTVLGVFVGVFGYCLIVLRSIRGRDEGLFVPSLAVLGGVALAFIGVGFLIFFVHHIASSIQASSIIRAAAEETIEAVDHLFPAEVGAEASEGADDKLDSLLAGQTWFVIPARATGYLQDIAGGALLRFAREQACVVRMERGIGEFVVEGSPLASVAGMKPDEKVVGKLNAACTVGRQRTVEQDAAFGIQQIVDVALKALSPGINDTTTAIICVDYLGAILSRLAARRIDASYRAENGELRVVTRGPTFTDLVEGGFDQIRQNAEGNPAVLVRLLESLNTIAARTTDSRRRQALLQQADLIVQIAERSIPSAHDRRRVQGTRESLSEVWDESRERQTQNGKFHPGWPA